jgi:DUF971 family protein
VKPTRFEVVGSFLAIRWDDGTETVVSLESVRRGCRCARCAGEPDLTGRVHFAGPPQELVPASFELVDWEPVGLYAVHLRWGDGHDAGIYTFEHLAALGAAEADVSDA